MKVTIDLENLQNIIESTLDKNIETVVKEKVSDLISEQIKNTAEKQIEEICNKRMQEFVEEYIKTAKITVGGGFYSDEEIKEYTVEQYIKNQLSEIMKNQSFKTYEKDNWGGKKEKEVTFDNFVKETFDVNSNVKMNKGDNLKCEKCGKEISSVLVNMFNYDGTDDFYKHIISECEENAAYVDTTNNWTGYELSEEEMIDTVKCPYCNEFPFKNKEIQIHEIVRLVFFKDGDINSRIQNS